MADSFARLFTLREQMDEKALAFQQVTDMFRRGANKLDHLDNIVLTDSHGLLTRDKPIEERSFREANPADGRSRVDASEFDFRQLMNAFDEWDDCRRRLNQALENLSAEERRAFAKYVSR